MPYNGSGTFDRVYNWVTDKTNSVPITASRMDGEDDGFATGLSNCITKDGQTTISANIPFNSKKITGLGNGSARTDSIALGQVQDNTYEYLGENGGSADAYTWAPSPAIEAYAAGQSWIITIGTGDDNTTASTAAISGLPTRNMEKSDNAGSTTALESGDLIAGGMYFMTDNGSKLVVHNPGKPIKPAGSIVQVVNTSTAAVATGTTTIPTDDTIPQNTEGDEYLTLAITPQATTNKLLIIGHFNVAHSVTANITAGLFQDSTADALNVSGQVYDAATGGLHDMELHHFMSAGTTSSTTFKIRIGGSTAGTTTINGVSGSRRYGGVYYSSLTIIEIKA